jgi:hypothetical protein
MTLLRDPSRLPPTNQALFEHFSLPFARLSHHHRSRRRRHHHHKAVAACVSMQSHLTIHTIHASQQRT